MLAWIMSRLSAQIALPIMGILMLTNIASGVALAITRHTLHDRTVELAAETKAHLADLATFKAATAQAEADDKAHAIAVQQKQDQISKEKQDELQSQLADARAIAAKWMRTHGAPATNHSSSQGTSVPSATNPTGQPDSTPAAAIVSAADIDACAIDYTIAKGWQDWYAQEFPAGKSMATIGTVVPFISMNAQNIVPKKIPANPALSLVDTVDAGSRVVSIGAIKSLGTPIDLTRLIKPLAIADMSAENVNGGDTNEPTKN